VSWVLRIGFVIVVGVRWVVGWGAEVCGDRWGVGAVLWGRGRAVGYFVIRFSASLVRRDIVSRAFLRESSA